jgi:hypothetical protein
MFVNDDGDELRVGPERYLRRLSELAHEIVFLLRRQASLDMALDEWRGMFSG